MSAVRGRGRGLTRGWGEAGWRLDGGWMEAEDSSASIVSGGGGWTEEDSSAEYWGLGAVGQR